MSAAALKEAATGTGSAVAERKEASPVVEALAKSMNAMKAVLPKHLTPEKMSRLALSVLRTNRKLAETAHNNPQSFVAAVLTAGQLGLELGVFGEAHLVPFGSEIALIPGYQGLVKLARNSRMVVDIYAHEVRANDEFEMTYGLNRSIMHKPLSKGGFPASDAERGEITGFYAVAELATGSRTFFAISLAEALRTRNESKGWQAAQKYKKDHPWGTHFEQMGRKTAIRRLCNMLPKSAELAAALAIDGANDRGTTATIDTDFTVIAGDDDVRTPAGPADKETGEIEGQPAAAAAPAGDGAPTIVYEDLLAALQNAEDTDTADAKASLIGMVDGADRQNRLTEAYQKRRAELTKAKKK